MVKRTCKACQSNWFGSILTEAYACFAFTMVSVIISMVSMVNPLGGLEDANNWPNSSNLLFASGNFLSFVRENTSWDN